MGGAKSSSSARAGGIVPVAPTVSSSPPAPVLPPGVRVSNRIPGTTEYKVAVGSNTLNFFAEQGGGYMSYSFQVNGSLTRTGAVDPVASRQIANQVLRIARYDVSTRPEGTVMAVSAVTWDGAGESRARAYTAFGFSRPARAGDSQYAIKRDGRLQPLTIEQFHALRRRSGYL